MTPIEVFLVVALALCAKEHPRSMCEIKGETYLRRREKVPIEFGAQDGGPHCWNGNPRVLYSIAAGLQHKYRDVWVFSQTCGHDETGGTTADDNEVIVGLLWCHDVLVNPLCENW